MAVLLGVERFALHCRRNIDILLGEGFSISLKVTAKSLLPPSQCSLVQSHISCVEIVHFGQKDRVHYAARNAVFCCIQMMRIQAIGQEAIGKIAHVLMVVLGDAYESETFQRKTPQVLSIDVPEFLAQAELF